MANLYDSSATGALNEKEYIDKIFDTSGKQQQDLIAQNYKDTIAQLDKGQQQTQQQTGDYLHRTEVENAKLNQGYRPNSDIYKAQLGLSMGNQNQANTTALQTQQTVADQEFERLRKLRGEKYQAEIKKAQADGDMHRAQMLLDAARAEEDQLRELRQQAAGLMASKDDLSILQAIAKGEAVTPSTGPTWDAAVKYEDDINEIYDKQFESAKLSAQMERDAALSELKAKQEAAVRQTDENLTKAYVDSLRSGRNYTEFQAGRGQGSGVAVQAQLARDNELTQKLTELRKLQGENTLASEKKASSIVEAFGDEIAKAKAQGDLKRLQELYSAAEKEEQKLVADQKFVGQQLAAKNDYSVLGKLLGLTQDQIDRLQGTGKYAPVYEEEYTPSKKKPGRGSGGGSSGQSSSQGSGSGYVKPVYPGLSWKDTFAAVNKKK